MDELFVFVDLFDFKVVVFVNLGGGEGGRVCLFKVLFVGMLIGVFLYCRRVFDVLIFVRYIGGDGDGDGENVGDG